MIYRRFRRTLSLVGLAITLVFFAKASEIMHQQAQSIIATRAGYAESLSVLANASVDDMRRFEAFIKDAVSRNPELTSIGIQNRNGRYLASTSTHEELWPTLERSESNDQYMSIPLTIGHREWGYLQLTFVPIAELTPQSFAHVELRTVALFTSPLCLLLVTMIIRFALRLRANHRKSKVTQEKDREANIQRVQTDFLSKFNCELVPPINVIMGYTEILRRGMEESSEQRKEYLNWIYNSSTHILELARDIADLASIEAGEFECEIKDCSPCKLISDVVALANTQASRQAHYVRCHMDGEIPETIQTDPTRVHRIMMNLVGNSIRNTRAGGITMACRFSKQKSELEFQVLDTGIIYSESELSQMFDAPSVAALGVGESYFGFGICKKFAEALGGSFTAVSEAGQGSTFTVRLPCEAPKQANMLSPGEAMQKIQDTQQYTPTITQGRIKQSRILVVDDADTTRHLVRLILTRSGLEIDEACNGLEAMEKIASCKYDLVLMDMKMPVMDGFTATQNLRKKGFTNPIIALTASTRIIDRQRCKSAGCNDISPKPIDFDKLYALLLSLLGEERPFLANGAFQDREFDISVLSESTRPNECARRQLDDASIDLLS